jgi:hypothetical protein
METGENSNSFKDCFGRTTDLKENNQLIIADNAKNISFSFIDTKNCQCVGLCSFLFRKTGFDNIVERQEIINEQPGIKKNHIRTIILFTNRECTLIPEEIYSHTDKEKYINLLFDDDYSGEYNTMYLPSLGNYLVYKIHSTVNKLYRELFPAAVFYHSTGFLLNTLGRISSKQKKAVVHLHFSKYYFEMAIFANGKLLFYNSFEFQTSEEIAYYILFALKQWKVETNEIMVSGLMNPYSDELYWLKKYIPTIVGFPVDELMPYPASIESPLSYINLLNPELCE